MIFKDTQEGPDGESASSFAMFLKQRHEAAAAFVCGDAAPFLEIVSEQKGSFFHPFGLIFTTPESTAFQYRRAADHLRRGEYLFETMAGGVSGDLGWVVGIQRGTISGREPDRLPQLDLRVTEIFENEGGAWKLIHRHADRLTADPGSKP